MTAAAIPPTSELFRIADFAPRHPTLLTVNRVQWALRNRDKNGLEAAGAIYTSPSGVVLIHEPAFIAWFLGLSGLSKPRASRRLRRRVNEKGLAASG
jgi:hypothetical protein